MVQLSPSASLARLWELCLHHTSPWIISKIVPQEFTNSQKYHVRKNIRQGLSFPVLLASFCPQEMTINVQLFLVCVIYFKRILSWRTLISHSMTYLQASIFFIFRDGAKRVLATALFIRRGHFHAEAASPTRWPSEPRPKLGCWCFYA